MTAEHGKKEVDFMPEDFPQGSRPALLLIAGAAVVGAITGVVGIAFLFCLRAGTRMYSELLAHLHEWPPVAGWLAICLMTAAAAAAAAWAVERFAPNARGSGVPDVENVLRGHAQPRHARVLPVKFIGGCLALSSGLLLGREGPLVQIGAVIGERCGRLVPGLRGAWKSLMAAGAGAGLATAFNAPVGGTIFILEEVFRKITPLTFILAATAASVSAFVQRAVFHMPQDYAVPEIPSAPASSVWVFFLFGLGLGFAGLLYNRLLLGLLDVSARIKRLPVPAKAAAIGIAVGTAGWFAPDWIGGGDELTQSLLANTPGLAVLLGMALLRFFLGPLSYAAGTPGGLFAPIVAMGAVLGSISGILHHWMLPGLVPSPLAFTVAGMAGLFTATIRAPLTGIVICLEMTGCYPLFFPMLTTCLGAYLIPTLLKNLPIYDALASRPPAAGPDTVR